MYADRGVAVRDPVDNPEAFNVTDKSFELLMYNGGWFRVVEAKVLKWLLPREAGRGFILRPVRPLLWAIQNSNGHWHGWLIRRDDVAKH